ASSPSVSVVIIVCAATGCTAIAKPVANVVTTISRREKSSFGERLSRSISKSCSFMGAPLHSSWKCWEDYKQTADCHVLLDRFTKLCFPFCREFCGWLRRAERGFEAMSNLGWI